MWAVAGPTFSRILADAGATVIRVESSIRLDACRTFLPFINNDPGPENSALFNNMNAGKLGITLNPGTPAVLEVAHDLIRWADVVCEAYTPRAMRSWGLDYDNVREINPTVVMLSTCLFGQSGPLANFAGYGNLSGAMAGFYNITGWGDRAPVGPYGAITDYTSPHPALASLLAAVDHQRRTGEGRYIDFSQAEASIHFIAPAMLEYLRPGTVVERRCQDAGVAAHRVQNSPELAVDPQLTYRRHWVEVPHSTHGSTIIEAPRFTMSRSRVWPDVAAPALGEHLYEVLTEHLGYDADRVAELAAAEAFD